ncbi:MAG: hypothetical protein F6K53_38095 [Moorea sp. SIO4A1]|uniref:ISAzo13-like element transposase-related protein n=1 Tax=Moorena sp. SIO4A1 TaxID=2607835 RepID=UPI00144C66BD|nr:hypothetical protein [Moorena sp. SIO4A1]NEQ62869.1 hypothetical protein [Moorena sp. SIO4A1]
MGYHLVQAPSIVLVRSNGQIMDMSIIESLRIKFEALVPYMNEKLRRLWAASEAVALGENGIELVVFATGIGAKTVSEGIKELQQPLSSVATVAPSTRIRKPGGGRKSYEQSKPKLLKDLEELIDPITRGDPESPLRWTSKSTSKIAVEVTVSIVEPLWLVGYA